MPRVAHGARTRRFRNLWVVQLFAGPAGRGSEFLSLTQKHATHWFEKLLGQLYILAGVMFVLGSVCFLPGFEGVYVDGVWLYFMGGVIYLKTSLFDLEEAYKGGGQFEVCMNKMYVVGTISYLGATIMYAPAVEAKMGGYQASLAGSWGFIIGSLFFVMACFLNGAHTGHAFSPTLEVDDPSKVLLAKILVLCTTNSTMLGALLFLVGSVLYLPNIGCDDLTVQIGTWCFLVGSLFFTIAGILPVVRRTYANVEQDAATSLSDAEDHVELRHDPEPS
ncbi:hypothetical protein CTAYLR_005107 [Chrysophaeum taylorii]|uniref:YrhK domain-containing protein n=1 Tax=Chrysophaeum taylorii TaxID=2483200 RepID=A0AAD7UGL3_9STRA|nr:hypothetical protein CTAYLR_005107 [Chrysophaeum taylorii]